MAFVMAKRYWLRGGIVLIVALVSWAVYISSKQLARNQRIESEVEVLRQEADRIRRENETLSEKVQYFSGNDFREQEAKEKLGMKRAGEEVVVIKSLKVEGQEEDARSEMSVPARYVGEQYPNYRKWWNIFFPPS